MEFPAGMRHSIFITVMLLASLIAAPVAAQEFRLSTENDIISDHPTSDDLYTYSIAMAVERRGITASLRENAFTDRAAGTRFDETYLSLSRPFHLARGWSFVGEAGIVHLGKGLFGQRTQNAFHRLIGSGRVDLDYLGSSLHPRLAIEAGRTVGARRSLQWGPRLEVDLVPGLRSWVFVGADAAWRPAGLLALEVEAGERLTSVSYAPLKPHLATSAPAGSLGVSIGRHFFVSWSYNDYSDKREHLSAGWRVELGQREAESRRSSS